MSQEPKEKPTFEDYVKKYVQVDKNRDTSKKTESHERLETKIESSDCKTYGRSKPGRSYFRNK